MKDEAIFRSRGIQVADYLRQQLQRGHWSGRLPSERQLAHELGISRRSLRTALLKLEKENLIVIHPQSGTYPVQSKLNPCERPHSIGIVYASHPSRKRDQSAIIGKHLIIFDEIRRIYSAQQIDFDLYSSPYLKGNQVSSQFKKIFTENHRDCWILVSPTIPMQLWCEEHQVPAIILGTTRESSRIPSVGIDHYALCKHAAGEILRHGHQQIALILPPKGQFDDEQGVHGFLDGIRQSHDFHGNVLLEKHDTTREGVCRLANRLLKTTPLPTAWLVFRQGHFFTLFTHLLRAGVKVPRDISLICRDADLYIHDLVLDPTCYYGDVRVVARHAARLATRYVTGQCKPGERINLMPDFLPGQTLGKPALS